MGILCIGMGQAQAGPIQWSTVDGGNGNYFELVLPSTPADNYSWTAARDAAAAMSFEGSAGHLATVTSSAENDFLHDHFASQLYDSGIGTTNSTYAWIGLFAPTPTSNFEWITGEPFVLLRLGAIRAELLRKPPLAVRSLLDPRLRQWPQLDLEQRAE
jgi:hypothetical protein